jgi:hypothetical protein
MRNGGIIYDLSRPIITSSSQHINNMKPGSQEQFICPRSSSVVVDTTVFRVCKVPGSEDLMAHIVALA